MTKRIRISIKSANIELNAELLNTKTAEEIWDFLPIKTNVYRWGDEVYFDINLNLSLEPDARAEVEIGEIGYWDAGPGMAIFFGPTPASKGEKPVAASAVNIFAKVIGDTRILTKVKDDDEIIVEQILNDIK